VGAGAGRAIQQIAAVIGSAAVTSVTSPGCRRGEVHAMSTTLTVVLIEAVGEGYKAASGNGAVWQYVVVGLRGRGVVAADVLRSLK
jgi:hypothetical protein